MVNEPSEFEPLKFYCICTKFHENIFYSFKVTKRTWFSYWKLQRDYSVKYRWSYSSLCTLSDHASYLYQVSCKYLKGFQSYWVDTNSIIHKWALFRKNACGLTVLVLCTPSNDAKFCESISKGFRVIERTRNHDRRTDKQTNGRTRWLQQCLRQLPNHTYFDQIICTWLPIYGSSYYSNGYESGFIWRWRKQLRIKTRKYNQTCL